MELEFTLHFYRRFSILKHLEISSSGSLDVPREQTDGQTDSHDEANSRFSQFCEIAYKTVTILCPSVHNIIYAK